MYIVAFLVDLLYFGSFEDSNKRRGRRTAVSLPSLILYISTTCGRRTAVRVHLRFIRARKYDFCSHELVFHKHLKILYSSIYYIFYRGGVLS